MNGSREFEEYNNAYESCIQQTQDESYCTDEVNDLYHSVDGLSIFMSLVLGLIILYFLRK